MAVERQSMYPEEQQESEDEKVLERRQAQAGVIQFQLDYNSKHPRMAEGPFIDKTKTLWYFRASNSISTTHMNPSWFHYKPIPHSEYTPMRNLTPVSEEARERFAEAFPYLIESNAESTVYPEFEEFGKELEAAIKLAFEQRNK